MARTSTDKKLTHLKTILSEMGTVLVAYSGGVDSTFLAVTAYEVLGKNMLAVFAGSPVSPPLEKEDARNMARDFGFSFQTIESNEMNDPDFVANPPDRCYYCKRDLFSELKPIAQAAGITWIADGTNADDTSDYRPGRKASAEAGIRSPLLEAGLTKAEIRQLSREKGLPTWDRPASPCLASRIPYGTPVTAETLNRIARGKSTCIVWAYASCGYATTVILPGSNWTRRKWRSYSKMRCGKGLSIILSLWVINMWPWTWWGIAPVV